MLSQILAQLRLPNESFKHNVSIHYGTLVWFIDVYELVITNKTSLFYVRFVDQLNGKEGYTTIEVDETFSFDYNNSQEFEDLSSRLAHMALIEVAISHYNKIKEIK